MMVLQQPLDASDNRHLFHDNQTAAADPLLPPSFPTLAHLISGSANDSARVLRLLHSVYHPRNQYLLHSDRSASQTDRDALAVTVQSVPLFRAAQNVHVVGKADYVFSNGPSALSSMLHGASVLLRLSSNWDWFINLAAADYPLVTQDGRVIAVFHRALETKISNPLKSCEIIQNPYTKSGRLCVELGDSMWSL